MEKVQESGIVKLDTLKHTAAAVELFQETLVFNTTYISLALTEGDREDSPPSAAVDQPSSHLHPNHFWCPRGCSWQRQCTCQCLASTRAAAQRHPTVWGRGRGSRGVTAGSEERERNGTMRWERESTRGGSYPYWLHLLDCRWHRSALHHQHLCRSWL